MKATSKYSGSDGENSYDANKHAQHQNSSSSSAAAGEKNPQIEATQSQNDEQQHAEDHSDEQHAVHNDGGPSEARLRPQQKVPSSSCSGTGSDVSSDSDSPAAAAVAQDADEFSTSSSSSLNSLEIDYKDDNGSASWDMSSQDSDDDDSDEILYKQDGDVDSTTSGNLDGINANGHPYPKDLLSTEDQRFEYEDEEDVKYSKHSQNSSEQGNTMDDHTTNIFRQNNADILSSMQGSEEAQKSSAVMGQYGEAAEKDASNDNALAALVQTTIPQQLKIHTESDGDQVIVTSPTSSSDVYSAEGDPVVHAAGLNFAMEHRIFLKAALELLSQRDKYSGMEVDLNDPNTIKCGPLKKASHKASHLMRGIWKVKYVEIRRGIFSYYEDAVSKDAAHEGELLRKNIPLQANSCTCRAVKVQHKALTALPGGGAIFELTVEGRPKKLWMANSREERQAWINAIQDAMVGGSVTRGGSQIDHHKGRWAGGISPRSPYKKDLERYLKLQGIIRRSTSKESYLGGLSEIVGEKLNVPVQWMIEHAESSNENAKAFHEEATSVGVDQLWKDLVRDSVKINGDLFKGSCGHAPERIIGALTRSILLFDRSSDQNGKTSGPNKLRIIESQAVSYARDVLLAGNRTRTGGDSYYCVDALCKNSDLVVLCPSTREAEPLTITVEHVHSEQGKRGSVTHSMNDKSGWLKTRGRGLQKKWKKRYFVLSEGTLSYYEKALPRPHGLRGQLILSNAAMKISEEKGQSTENGKPTRHIVTITMNDITMRDREICFEDQNKFVLWTHALESAIGQTSEGKGPLTPTSVFNKLRMRSFEMGSSELATEDQKGLKDHAASLGIDDEALASRVAQLRAKNGRARSTVKISVQASTEYKICTTDPQGDDKEDTWATLRADFLQDFRVSGGPNGRITRGEEIVQVYVLDCQSGPHVSASASPRRARRRSLTRRLS